MSAPATRRVRRIGSDIMFHGHLITKEFLDSIPVGPFTIIPTSPAAMEAHAEAMADALMPYLDDDQIPASAARAALAALTKRKKT